MRRRLAGEAGKVEQTRDAVAHHGVLDAEVAAIDQQVFAAGEVGVEVVELGDDADPRARRFRVGRNRPPASRMSPAVRRGQIPGSSARWSSCRRRSGRAGRNRWRGAPRSRCRRRLPRRRRTCASRRAALRRAGPRVQCRHARLTISRITCRRRWKKWSAPGTTITGNSSGLAHSMTLARGTVVSSEPWMTIVSPGTALVW
jgi:hypothetical protein